jgi:hypothetical protein
LPDSERKLPGSAITARAATIPLRSSAVDNCYATAQFPWLDADPQQRQEIGMKISRLLPLVCASVFVAVPSLAASPAAGSSAPISLCGESKAEKGEKVEATDKAKQDTEKKDSKEKKKVDEKAAA